MTCTHPNAARSSQSATPLFALGRIVATPGALDLLDRHGIAADQFLRRHVTGDWGDVTPEDAKSNWLAIRHGSRILSSFSVGGERCWIITEADRSVTTLLLPSEY
ncbi:hypothetical protein [Burkholderia pseudomallei]|uniref:hypothetical protein n=1 Tax=Burkholderia pseudomallei TaxID=28450 RepID=UPI000531ACAF|nr:hypothetical protein [Burkholderia pseudomallei]KGS32874.1 putative type I restriction-modification system methyltransferase subunit [Burkholderia pseudomallei MSHR5569]KGU98974.1 putative type I restriction-modification system methyltransferase subunit [Burkholderia pseudomallei MSHR4372]MBM5664892.1 hypothetical protein [Burkholderia pseudomallei]